jgi:hypothetical protein
MPLVPASSFDVPTAEKVYQIEGRLRSDVTETPITIATVTTSEEVIALLPGLSDSHTWGLTGIRGFITFWL